MPPSLRQRNILKPTVPRNITTVNGYVNEIADKSESPRHWSLGYIIIFAVATLVYANTLEGKFVYDDRGN